MQKAIQFMTLALISAPLFLAAQTSNVTLPQDKGPNKIDVAVLSARAAESRTSSLTDKCSKCHTIARPINTTMTKEEWERYVKRMMHKPNSGISDSQGKAIFEFLAYDQADAQGQESVGILQVPFRRRD